MSPHSARVGSGNGIWFSLLLGMLIPAWITLAGCVSSGVEVSLPPDSRSLKEIQLGFERGVGKFLAVHSAYLNEHPDTTSHKIYLTFTVAPDGTMSECIAGSKNIAPNGLTRVIIEQASTLSFGAREVPPFHYENYPVVLLYEESAQSDRGQANGP